MGAAVVGPQKGVSVCVPASEPAGGRPRDVGSWERRCQVASPPAESWGCTSSSGRPDMIATGRVGRAPPVSAGSDPAAGAEWGRESGCRDWGSRADPVLASPSNVCNPRPQTRAEPGGPVLPAARPADTS